MNILDTISMPFHLIEQPYNDKHPEREEETWGSVKRNMNNPCSTTFLV